MSTTGDPSARTAGTHSALWAYPKGSPSESAHCSALSATVRGRSASHAAPASVFASQASPGWAATSGLGLPRSGADRRQLVEADGLFERGGRAQDDQVPVLGADQL